MLGDLSLSGSSPFYQSSSSEFLSRDASPEASADPSLDGPDLTQAVRLPGKKSKVPRPPNAFILYRQTHHPILKAEQPLLSNNQISVILGKQWKAEVEEVKDKFRFMADALKTKHAAENPGYQYAPRKPSEKKRRMTARKLSQLQSTKQQDRWEKSVEVADLPFGISATGYLGSERATFPSRFQSEENGDMSIIMPTGHTNVQADYETTMSPRHQGKSDQGFDFADPADRDTIYAGRSYTTVTAQMFMDNLIDWDGVFDDIHIIRTSTDQTRAEIESTGLDTQVLALESDLQCFEFQDEFDELLSMFE